jgi:esterase/lipase superfamily enzyme
MHQAPAHLPRRAHAALLSLPGRGVRTCSRPSNERMSKLLWSKDISNHLALWEGGAHDWPGWGKMVRQYLPW